MTENKHPRELEDALRRAYIRPVDPALRASQLQAMSQVEIEQVSEKVSVARPRRRIVRGIAAGAGLVLIGGSALAAGGDLPVVQDAVADLVDGVVDLPGGSAKGGNPKNPTAAANKAEAEAYTNAKKAYNACKKVERNASPAPVPSACGEKPERKDFEATKTPKPAKSPKAEKSPAADKTAKPDKTDKPDRTEKPERTPPPGLAEKTAKPLKTPKV
jgi:hypothetical protein